jgi:hypothetical protein
MKLNGKHISNKDHIVGPFVIERLIEEEVEVDVLDAAGDPTGEKATKSELKKHVFGIYAKPVWDYHKFNRLYPLPDAPVGGWSPKSETKGEKTRDFKNPQYLQDLETYDEAREGWTLLESISKASNLELDGISLDDPTTWPNILDAMKGGAEGETGLLSHFEYNKVIALVDEACGIDDFKLAENRKSFLSELQAKPSGQTKA